MKHVRSFPIQKHLSILISSLLISASVFAGISYFGSSYDAKAQVPSSLQSESANQAPVLVTGLPDFTQLVDKTSPAVVNIRTTQKISQMQSDPFAEDDQAQEFLRRFFGIPAPTQPNPRNRRQAPKQLEQEVPRGVGSGFIVSQDGYVLTNTHVVDGASEVYVKLNDKREFKAKVIGSDRRTDVAVLKIDGSKLPTIRIGDSDKIRAGEWVIAIGSPFDLDNTVTAGIISSKARDTGDFLPLIQTDVAVNPGNSGGPLINMRGEVIGINSQIYSRSGGYMGISFAIPIDEAMRVVDQLKTTGTVSRGRLGVEVGDLSKEVAESLGLPKPQGALIARVEAGGPADKAGLQDGDVILKFNGAAVEKRSDLPRIVGGTKPGTKATITIWRKGAQKEMTVVVGQAEPDNAAAKADKKSKKDSTSNVIGVTVSDLTEAQKRAVPNASGVVIESVEGAAALSGLRPGDVILMMNNVDVKDAKQFELLASKLDSKKPVVLLVRSGQSSQFVVIRPVQ
ncbi:DegQ family serine endoprotease [Undibacterium cyanobacteriorum]|uniref:Probable periplasmic serine endoprotease DegP-like n=1 Tax=Undibacterium cyanobacteriorum TaxID=3073561 RepID=A0ABY9RR32_9BURK|nr:DegQ family serine endoprotease [Undibacterium sp. 20NA77.5]WMW82406.1 DegQ family serine endoprotease [Undibacterium sp. 20NA77.5]